MCEVSCSSVHLKTNLTRRSVSQDAPAERPDGINPVPRYVYCTAMSAFSYHQNLTLNIWRAPTA